MQDYKSSGKCLLDEDMNEINFKEKLEEISWKKENHIIS